MQQAYNLKRQLVSKCQLIMIIICISNIVKVIRTMKETPFRGYSCQFHKWLSAISVVIFEVFRMAWIKRSFIE